MKTIDLKAESEKPVELAGSAWRIVYALQPFMGEMINQCSSVDLDTRTITINAAVPQAYVPFVTAKAIEWAISKTEGSK